jgi:hypothetical protein
VNTQSGNWAKVFTMNRIGCSRTTGLGVHDKADWMFTMGRNMHTPRYTSPYGLYPSTIMVCAAVQVGVMASWIGQDEQARAGVNRSM